ncbi:conjugal transfer protein TrbF [Pelagibacterium luteolum]|uniref:Type IV secretion system protein VirB5 n=1 Tax=Pelagibacterium luteolum TaxID=440168 RepID=A0A1G7ZZ38_9HYPH|nr:conjugal transfer protein TrbF [Pelagibacterium luteolum]SDH13911.1 type IV secretion system protein VirB5 [Pelagibacterium luteolum]
MAKAVPENPYIAARQEWSERYGQYVRAAEAWRVVAMLAMGMAIIGFGYALYQSTQVKFVPYIVEVDQHANAVLGGFPGQIEYADERVVRAMLGQWVSNFRSVTPDTVVQTGYINRTYALLRRQDPSTAKVSAWFRNQSPFDAARERTVSVEVNSVVALSGETYQIDWTEIERDRSGREAANRRWRGIATVVLSPPQDEAIIRLNPIGLYLADFEWTAQL